MEFSQMHLLVFFFLFFFFLKRVYLKFSEPPILQKLLKVQLFSEDIIKKDQLIGSYLTYSSRQ